MPKPLTLFGEFVTHLREHFMAHGSRSIGKAALVLEITGQGDASQASRYMHEYLANKELYWYHKSTIAQIIIDAGSDQNNEPELVSKVGRGKGYKFIGRKDDPRAVETLGNAIARNVGRYGPNLEDFLVAYPLTPDCPFCRSMYGLYDSRYGGGDGRTSSLEQYVRAVDEDLDAGEKSKEIYRRVLLAILLGPEAVPAMAIVSKTARMGDFDSTKVVDGFSLTQLVVTNGEILPGETFGYELGADVPIGLRSNPEAIFCPTFGEDVRPFVSFDHAVIRQVGGEGDEPAWRIVNLSESNGTAVRHADGSVGFTRTRGEGLPLLPGDEIWLAPTCAPGGVFPEYRHGAVLHFDHLTSRYHMTSGASAAAPAPAPADTDEGQEHVTPVYEGSRQATGPEESVCGFILSDITFGTGSRVFRYDDLADDDGFFTLSIGRQGDYATGVFFGSAVARRHAYIEPVEQSDLVMLTNCSANEVVVRHSGGTFDEIGEWQYAVLADDDEIYFAGGTSDSGPLVAANGCAISFRYVHKFANEA